MIKTVKIVVILLILVMIAIIILYTFPSVELWFHEVTGWN